jgi:hypothetical protein
MIPNGIGQESHTEGVPMAAKIVTNPHYHVWTDALHYRELARQTQNAWDRGTYVRGAVTTAWTAFEMSCSDALGVSGLGMRFRERIDEAVEQLGLDKLDWGSGLWQQIGNVYRARINYTHIALTQVELLAELQVAEHSIGILRAGIKDIYTYVGRTPPGWEDDDSDRGWDDGKGVGAHMTLVHAGVDEADPLTIRIAYVYKGREYTSCLLPPAADYRPQIQELLTNVRVPISAVRVYRGLLLEEETELQMRGT